MDICSRLNGFKSSDAGTLWWHEIGRLENASSIGHLFLHGQKQLFIYSVEQLSPDPEPFPPLEPDSFIDSRFREDHHCVMKLLHPSCIVSCTHGYIRSKLMKTHGKIMTMNQLLEIESYIAFASIQNFHMYSMQFILPQYLLSSMLFAYSVLKRLWTVSFDKLPLRLIFKDYALSVHGVQASLFCDNIKYVVICTFDLKSY